MLKQKVFRLPPTVIFGCKSADKVGEESQKIGGRKALIVTDEILAKLGTLEPIKQSLKKEKIEYAVFDKIFTEPTVEFVRKGVAFYRDNRCDFIITVGGGSAIDTAKAISVMLTNSEPIAKYKGLDKIPLKGVSLIAVPTTAGTGSEVTMFTIINEAVTNEKMLIGSPHVMPQVALVDPLLTVSMPRELTSATGVDALCHAIEAYVSLKAHPLSDMFALSAIEFLSGYLRKAWANGENLEAREKMMLGALNAGIAFNNASVTLVHGMSRPIGAWFHVPHGVSNAVLLDTVMEFSLMGCPERFARVAKAMGVNAAGLTDMEAAQLGVRAVRQLIKDIKIPSMEDLGVEKHRFEKVTWEMAEAAIASGSPGNNPRQVTKEEIVELYLLAYK